MHVSLSMKDFWERHTDIISHGLTFQGKADESFPTPNWDDVVGETALEDFFAVPSLTKQQAIFDSWPLEELKKRFRYMERTIDMQICSCHNCNNYHINTCCNHITLYTHNLHRRLRAHVTHRLSQNKRFQFIEQSDAEIEVRMWGRLIHICTHVPAKDNFFLSWYLRGSTGYDPLTKPDFCPPYLQEKSFERLKVRCIVKTMDATTVLCCTTRNTRALKTSAACAVQGHVESTLSGATAHCNW